MSDFRWISWGGECRRWGADSWAKTHNCPSALDDEDQRSPALYDPAELDEDCDIPPERRRRILDAYYQVDEVTHYELLGVDETATKKEIKTAYFELAAEYHPDRYFRKNLGNFKQKMEVVFTRVTQAHDTLTRKQSRSEYDAYLSTLQRTKRIERVLRDGGRSARRESMPPQGMRDLLGQSAPSRPPPTSTTDPRVERPAEVTQEPRARSTTGPSGATPETRRPTSSVPIRSKESAQARREAFAARLSGGRVSKFPPARGTSAPEPSPKTTLAPEQAAEALRRHMVERKSHAKNSQLKRYLDGATEAMQRGDPAAAANSYRLAMQMAPDDEEIKRAYEDADQAATVMLADGYLRQGEYEERAERWREAARSYSRAADGMPNRADVQNKAAHAMLRADLDLRKAADYAKRATGLEPNKAEFHLNLGQIYLAVGLALNAKREIELAAELAPEDAKIARLLQAVRTG